MALVLDGTLGLTYTGDTAASNNLAVPGNVGVGTSSPVSNTNQRSVTINGTSFSRVDFQTGGSSTAYIYSGLSNTNLGTIGATAIAFDTNSTERVRIDSSGNVGIGTSSPDATLRIDSTNGSRVRFGFTTGGLDYGIYQSDQGGVDANYFSNNAGIGTPSPAAKLDIFTSSAGGFHYPIFLSANNSASAKTNYLQLGFSIQQALAGSETGGFDLKALRNNTPVYLANYEGAAGAGTWKFYTDGSERLKITTAGTLAITQAAGTNTIDVSGNATSIANGGTVGFANASGMLVVNNHTNGNITIFLGGGGITSVVSSVGAQVGTFAYTSGNAGYTWTSNYGSTATYAFYFLKTRPTA